MTLSDHLPHFLIFDKYSSLPANVKLYKRDYSKFDQEKLSKDIRDIDWITVFFIYT